MTSVLDLVVDGMNLTARVGESQTAPFLRDLGYAAADLSSGRRGRVTLPFYLHDDPWELGLVRDGDGVLLTLFRGGAAAEVAVHERALRGEALLGGLRRAFDELLGRRGDGAEQADLRCARAMLDDLAWQATPAQSPAWQALEVEGTEKLSFGCDLLLRAPSPDEPPPSVARNDLLPLLVRSRLRLVLRGQTRELGEGYAFLVAERLVDVAEQCLEAASHGQMFQRRFEAGGVQGGVQLGPDGALTLTLKRPGATGGGERYPGLDARTLAHAAVGLGRAVSRALLRNDRAQGQNLRLDGLRGALRRLGGELKPREQPLSQVNQAPESYRAYALGAQPRALEQGPGLGAGKLRFVARWEATVPGLDLGSTFLCGDRLVVTGGRELAAIGRNTGEMLWTRQVQRAVAVPTPGGLARLLPDGQVQVHDYGTGEPTLTLRLAPRLGGAMTGAVVHAPGLPKLLVVTEGERHLSAIDLVSGEVRWRTTLARGGATRLRRAGKLLLECSGDAVLTALDIPTGETVWRLRTNAPCATAPAFDHDTLFLLTGEASGRRGRPSLQAIDAWTGAVRYEAALPARPAAQGQPLLTADTVAVLTRDDRGTGLMAFDRASGQLRYQLATGLAPLGSSWLAVDGCLFANTDRGELLGVDATTGELKLRLRLGDGGGDAVPRKLDPVLRSGALFVPQREVHVVRPRDGELLGKVPSELVPDLLRVDERCDIYIGEESGHLAAFGNAPRLSLVKG
ncbi:MAG: hypothetical protein EOO75_00640 [Myxococcales bacterium]|nr:MAG: hypothetical protein EOO75_00640 [Myxococcales bacterium]